MVEPLNRESIFVRLHKGENITCPECGNGKVLQMSDRPIEQEFCFECNNCKAHFRYDPVSVVVE